MNFRDVLQEAILKEQLLQEMQRQQEVDSIEEICKWYGIDSIEA